MIHDRSTPLSSRRVAYLARDEPAVDDPRAEQPAEHEGAERQQCRVADAARAVRAAEPCELSRRTTTTQRRRLLLFFIVWRGETAPSCTAFHVLL